MQASLVPSVLALCSFFSSSFPHIDWYPYWYLGSPFRYLIGPVVPYILYSLKDIFPFVDLYYLYIGFIVFSLFIGGFGIYLFVFNLGRESLSSDNKRILVGLFSGVLYILLPINWLTLYFQNGLVIIAFAIIPYVFWLYDKWLPFFMNPSFSWYRFAILVLLVSICLLITVDSLLVLVIGLAIILFCFVHGRLFSCGVVILRSVLVFLFSICLSTFWYGFGFWWVTLFNPSLGGSPLWHVLLNILSSSFQFIPFALAVLFVKWRHLFFRKELAFVLYFSLTFFILTIVRFISNPVFVIDWLGFGTEIQFACAVLGGLILGKLKRRVRIDSLILYVFTGLFASSLVFFVFLINGILFYTKSNYKTELINFIKMHNIDKNERFFFSGSPVFWINQYLPLLQVRGGNDSASLNTSWAEGAYQIREGDNSSLTEAWLQIFGSSFVLLNQYYSQELFHDFKHVEKFHQFTSFGDFSGNELIKIPGASIGRIVNSRLLLLNNPSNGADTHTLFSYVDSFIRPISIRIERPDLIRFSVNLNPDELLSLAVTYDPGWHLRKGNGVILSDSLGNLVIAPEHYGRQQFVLEYTVLNRRLEFFILLVFIIFLATITFFSELFFSIIVRVLNRFHFGINEEETY